MLFVCAIVLCAFIAILIVHLSQKLASTDSQSLKRPSLDSNRNSKVLPERLSHAQRNAKLSRRVQSSLEMRKTGAKTLEVAQRDPPSEYSKALPKVVTPSSVTLERITPDYFETAAGAHPPADHESPLKRT